MKTFKAGEWAGTIHIGKYQVGGAPCLQWGNEVDGPLATLTSNPDESPAEGCCWLKTWSENEQLDLERNLVEQGFGELTGRMTRSGFVLMPEFRLNMEAFA